MPKKKSLLAVFFLIFLATSVSAAWWDTDWDARFPINDLAITSNLAAGDVIRLENIDFSDLLISCADLNDVRIVNDSTGEELKRRTEGSTQTQDGNIFFSINHGLASGTYDGRFYIYSSNSACPSPPEKVNFSTVLEDFNSTADWTVSQADGATQSSQNSVAHIGNALKITTVGDADNDNFEIYRALPDLNSFRFWARFENHSANQDYLLFKASIGGATISTMGFNAKQLVDVVTTNNITALDYNAWYEIEFDQNTGGKYNFTLYNADGNIVERHIDRTSWDDETIVPYIFTRDDNSLQIDSFYDEITSLEFDSIPSFTIEGVFDGEISVSEPDSNQWLADQNVSLKYVLNYSGTDCQLTLTDTYPGTDSNVLFTGIRKAGVNYSEFYYLPSNYNHQLSFDINCGTDLDLNFFVDTTEPDISVDLNFADIGFTQDVNTVNLQMIINCHDSLSETIGYFLSVNDVNSIDANYSTDSNVATNLDFSEGTFDTVGRCVDKAGNIASDVNQFSMYFKYFLLVNEETAAPFNLADINTLTAFSPDYNFSFDFKTDGNSGVYYVVNADDSVRFRLGYDNAGTIEYFYRDIAMSALPTDANIGICVPEFQTIYEQLVISSTERRVRVINPFSNCYVLADYTKYAYENAFYNKAYTITMPYNLYVFDGNVAVLLANVEGGTATAINLDVIEYRTETYNLVIADDSFSVSKVDANTLYFYYKNLKADNIQVNFKVYDGDTLKLNYTETGSPNDVGFYVNYTTWSVQNKSLEVVVTATTASGAESETYYISLEAEFGFLDGFIAIAFSFMLFFFGITLTSVRYALGWFGIILSGLSIVILSFAIVSTYTIFMQMIMAVILVYIILVFKNESVGVS